MRLIIMSHGNAYAQCARVTAIRMDSNVRYIVFKILHYCNVLHYIIGTRFIHHSSA